MLLYSIMEQSGLVFTEIKSKHKGETRAKKIQKIAAALEEEPDLHFHFFESYSEC